MADDGVMGPAIHGLRERKKRATRRALGEAALRLAADRGLERLTVEDISEAAGVSTRTFFNYFSGKEEAIIGDTPLVVAPANGPGLIRGGESILDGLHRLVRDGAAGTASRRDEVRLRRQVMERYPALVPRMFARIAEFERSLASAVAARSGAGPRDAYPQLMAAVASTAVRVAIIRWSTDHGDRTLEHHLDEMFGLLKAELGQHGVARVTSTAGPAGGTGSATGATRAAERRAPGNGTSPAHQDSKQEGQV
jgi:AcrR family transcriptional regulator